MSYPPPPPPPEGSGQPGQPHLSYRPPGYGAYGHTGSLTRRYAGWWSRVAAYLIDALIAFAIAIVPLSIGVIMMVSQSEVDEYGAVTEVNPAGLTVILLGLLIALAFVVWNRGIRTGKTGQSIGRKALNIEVVSSENGQYIGAGLGVGRWLLEQVLGNLCFVNYLWPLWDDQRRSWHDMIVSTVVVQK